MHLGHPTDINIVHASHLGRLRIGRYHCQFYTHASSSRELLSRALVDFEEKRERERKQVDWTGFGIPNLISGGKTLVEFIGVSR